jgi:hypothetical protein
MRRRNVVWIWVAVGAWMCGLAWILHWAMPRGYYFDGKEHPWVPAWIPTILGLIIFSLGLIPAVKVKPYWLRRRFLDLRSSVFGSQTLPVPPTQPEEGLPNRLP